MTVNPPLVAVYVVTFRRHQMLRRAIASVVAQTYANAVKVVNDDPEDEVGLEKIGQ